MGKTKISWTEETWNPVTGCSHVSEGCRNCYAERMDRRIRGARGEEFKPWTASHAAYNVRLWPDRLDAPLHWKKPRCVFVNSMSDLFHEQVPDDFIAHVFAVMAACQRHTFQVLTKRPERMQALMSSGGPNIMQWMVSEDSKLFYTRVKEAWVDLGLTQIIAVRWPLPNVWLGVSVEDQKSADERIARLLQTPAAVRFVSVEPLLGPVNAEDWLDMRSGCGGEYPDKDCAECGWQLNKLDWVIVGGESGPHFRPMNLDWARSLRDQCVNAQAPFFFKQESGLRPGTNALLDGMEWHQYPD